MVAGSPTTQQQLGPPTEIDGWRVLRWAGLQAGVIGRADRAVVVVLAEDEAGYRLLACDEQWAPVLDTWHPTFDGALQQAFIEVPWGWQVVAQPTQERTMHELPQFHDASEERSWRLHQPIVRRLRSREAEDLLARAHARNEDRADVVNPVWIGRWRRLVGQGAEAVARVLEDPDERGQSYRQTAPFAGELPPAERWAILRVVRDRWERRGAQ